MSELLPCPFCGAPAKEFDGETDGYHYVTCSADCDVGPCSNDKEAQRSRKQWNRRAAPEHAAPVCPYIVTNEEGTNYCKLGAPPSVSTGEEITFTAFRRANTARCVKWHPRGIASWSPSDWLTAVTGELGELASLLKMRNRERDGLPGNKFSPTDKQIADEIADVFTYLDLLAEVLGIDLGRAVVSKFNEISERVGFPDRIPVEAARALGREEGK